MWLVLLTELKKHFGVSDVHIVPSPFFTLDFLNNVVTIRGMDHQIVCECIGGSHS